ncbi:MAG: transglycosylase, partial [Actinomycetota bacterium]|nr:transglycosylase [Actinomycetota bacterium]
MAEVSTATALIDRIRSDGQLPPSPVHPDPFDHQIDPIGPGAMLVDPFAPLPSTFETDPFAPASVSPSSAGSAPAPYSPAP